MKSYSAAWDDAALVWIDMSKPFRPCLPEYSPCVDWRHLSSPDSSNHHAARKHVPVGRRECAAAGASGMKRAPVPSGAEAGAVPPVGLEPTTFGLKVRSSDQLS